jgi:NADH-quinone oxidoreductase subunit N
MTEVNGIPGLLDDIIRGVGFIYPELVITAGFLLVISADLLLKRSRLPVFLLTLITLGAAACLTVCQFYIIPDEAVFGGMLRLTQTGVQFKLIFYLVSALFAVFAFLNREIVTHRKGAGDLFSVLLSVTLGMNFMAESANLLMIYISIELVSLGSYLMVGYTSKDGLRSEAALKYVLFGAVSSAVMVYGMSLAYAFTGSLNLFDPAFIEGLTAASPIAAGVALTMILAGIGFKLSFVPLHIWSPDVYEGAPTPVTAFLSAGPKLAGFALIVLFLDAFPAGEGTFANFYAVLGIVSILSMIAGNFAAIWQDNTKRMLAYSSIGHTGFMLMAVLAGHAGESALLYYGLTYTLMITGALLLADHLEEQTGALTISAYKGFGKYFPLTMSSMVVLMIAMTGIPPTAGFFGKLLVFSAVWEHYRNAGSALDLALMITGALTTVVSLFYYFKIPLYAWLRSSELPLHAVKHSGPKVILATLLALLVVLLGLFPGLSALW